MTTTHAFSPDTSEATRRGHDNIEGGAEATLSRRRKWLAERSDDERRVLTAVAERLRQTRQRRGWTQRELAQRAGVDPSQIATLEAGIDNATVLTLAALARALQCSVALLLRGA